MRRGPLELLSAASSHLGEQPFGLTLADVRAAAERIAKDSEFQPPQLRLTIND